MHLLDANALIALGWPAHQHHEAMVAWFADNAVRGWATCALTQAAFVRILSQPVVARQPLAVAEVAALLARNLAHRGHRLLSLDFAFDEVLKHCTGGLVGHRQIGDAYLLTAAMRAGIQLLTFDSGVRQLLASDAARDRHVVLL